MLKKWNKMKFTGKNVLINIHNTNNCIQCCRMQVNIKKNILKM